MQRLCILIEMTLKLEENMLTAQMNVCENLKYGGHVDEHSN